MRPANTVEPVWTCGRVARGECSGQGKGARVNGPSEGKEWDGESIWNRLSSALLLRLISVDDLRTIMEPKTTNETMG